MEPSPAVVIALYILAILSLAVSSLPHIIQTSLRDRDVFHVEDHPHVANLEDSLRRHHQVLARLTTDYLDSLQYNGSPLPPKYLTDPDSYRKATQSQWYPDPPVPGASPVPRTFVYPQNNEGELLDHVQGSPWEDVLQPHLEKVKFAGLRFLAPLGIVHTHTDPQSVLMFHHHLVGDGSLTVVNHQYIANAPLDSLLFDPTFPHSLHNDRRPVVIFYADVIP
jgi:hypothetical protein